MWGLLVLVNLLLASQVVLGSNPRITGGFLDERGFTGDGFVDNDLGAEVVLDFRPLPVPTPVRTSLGARVRNMLTDRNFRRSARYSQAFELLVQTIEQQEARAKQEASDRKQESRCNRVATIVNTTIAVAGFGLAVWTVSSVKVKQD